MRLAVPYYSDYKVMMDTVKIRFNKSNWGACDALNQLLRVDGLVRVMIDSLDKDKLLYPDKHYIGNSSLLDINLKPFLWKKEIGYQRIPHWLDSKQHLFV